MLANRYGYENGLPLREIAKRIYGFDDLETQQKTRQNINRIKKLYGICVYSVKPLGGKFRFCILNDPDECNQVLERNANIMEGIGKANRRIENRKVEIEFNEKIQNTIGRRKKKKVIIDED